MLKELQKRNKLKLSCMSKKARYVQEIQDPKPDFGIFKSGSRNKFGRHVTDTQLKLFFENSKSEEDFKEIELKNLTSLSEKGFLTLFRHEKFNKLETLTICNCDYVSDEVLAVIATANLRRLTLMSLKFVNSEGYVRFFMNSQLPKLERLSLKNAYAFDDTALTVLSKSQLPKLTRIDLRKCDQLTNQGLKALSESEILPRVTHLNISGCYQINGDDLREFLKPRFLISLRHFKMKHLSGVRDADIDHFIASEVGKQLETLTFKHCKTTDLTFQILYKAGLHSLTELVIPITSWYLEQILNSSAMIHVNSLEIYDIRELIDDLVFANKLEYCGKFDIIQKRLDNVLSISKYLTNLNKLKIPQNCKLSKFWASQNCLKLVAFNYIGRGNTMSIRKRTAKQFVDFPPIKTLNQTLRAAKSLVITPGADYILGKDLRHVECLFIENIQHLDYLATARFENLKTLFVTFKEGTGEIERFAEIDMRPSKLIRFKITGNCPWSFLTDALPRSRNFSYLQVIKMGALGLSNNHLHAFKNLQALSHLKKITFYRGSISYSALSAIIANAPFLEEISLRDCTCEKELAPNVAELVDFKGLIKTRRDDFFDNIYLPACNFRLLVKKKSGSYADGRTAASGLPKVGERPYEDFNIILSENPEWTNRETGGHSNLERTIDKFNEYYEKNNRSITWIKNWDPRDAEIQYLANEFILPKCKSLKKFRLYDGESMIPVGDVNPFKSVQSITLTFFPKEEEIELFGSNLTDIYIFNDEQMTITTLKASLELLSTHEKCKYINLFLARKHGKNPNKELWPFDELMNLVTTTAIKNFRYFEIPACKFDFTPDNQHVLKTIFTQLATLKINQQLLLSLLIRLVECFEKHLANFKQDNRKEEQILKFFSPLLTDSIDIAEIICFYAISYGNDWLYQAIIKIIASISMTPEDIKRLYFQEIWDITTIDALLKDMSNIHNSFAIELAFQAYQEKPNDKMILSILGKILSKLSAAQLKAIQNVRDSESKKAKSHFIFKHPVFYDTEHPWTFEEYSLTFADLDTYLSKHKQDISPDKRIVLWDKVEHKYAMGEYEKILDCTRVNHLIFNFNSLKMDWALHEKIESFNIKTVTYQVNVPKNYSDWWLPKSCYEKLERINIQMIRLNYEQAEAWKWLIQIMENIKPTCTLCITAEDHQDWVVPLEVHAVSSVKVKTLILQGKSAFTFLLEVLPKLKLQRIDCERIKIKRKDKDNWDEEKTNDNEKKVLDYIGQLKDNLDDIRLDIPLKLNSLISILQNPQWLQIKSFSIMSSGINEELELIARAKNLSSLIKLHIDFAQRIKQGESLKLYLQGIKALLSASKDIFKNLDWGYFFSVHSKYGLISHDLIKEAIKRNIFRERSFRQWTLFEPHQKFPILPETVIKVLENADVENFDIIYFITKNKGHDAISPKVYSYYVSGQFKAKILLSSGSSQINFYDEKYPTHTQLLDLLITDKLTQADLDEMTEHRPQDIDDDFINIMCTFADIIIKHHIVMIRLREKHKHLTHVGLNQLVRTFEYKQYPSLYKWIIDSTHYLHMANLDTLTTLSTRDILFFDIKRLYLSQHNFLCPSSSEDKPIFLYNTTNTMIGKYNKLNDATKNKRDNAILGLISQCQGLKWLYLDKLNLDDVFCMKLAVLHNEKLKNKNNLQLISIEENPYITYVGLKFLYSIPIADEAFRQSPYGIIANCEVILDIPDVVVLNDGIHAAIKSKFREYKRKKKAQGFRYYDHSCIPLLFYSIVCFPFAFIQYFDEEISHHKYLSRIKGAVHRVSDKIKRTLNMQVRKVEYAYFADMNEEEDKQSGRRLKYIFSKGCIQLNTFLSDRYIWSILYVIHAMLYYFFAVFVPIHFMNECDSGKKFAPYVGYGIYGVFATISEFGLLRKAIQIISNHQVAQLNLMVLVPLAISQNNKLSLFTDMLYVTTAYSCQNTTRAVISTVALAIYFFMNILQIFNLLIEYIITRRGTKTHNSTYIDMVAKFCYSMDLTTISSLLEKVSICCADQLGRTYVPQILQTIGLKTMSRTFPLAILQLNSFISSDLSNNFVYLFSFIVSILNLILAFYSVITAQPSACTPATIKKVFYKDFKDELKHKDPNVKKKPSKIASKRIAFARASKKEEPTKKSGAIHYEKIIEESKKKYTRKGKVFGYYVKYKECPIEGTYTMNNGVLEMLTVDGIGTAKWDGVISIYSGKAKIAKRYKERHFVAYNGNVNFDNVEDVEVSGLWSLEGSGGQFKLTFQRESQEPAEKISPTEVNQLLDLEKIVMLN